MKKAILLLFIAACAVACGNTATENTTLSIEWVNNHKKPIRCIESARNMAAERSYTLIDSSGTIYSTGWTSLALPEILK